VATADLALALVALLGAAAVVALGRGVVRSVRGWTRWQHEQRVRREQLEQERLKTAILEEQLRNEVLRDIHARSRTPER
jgi:hypothetical protein